MISMSTSSRGQTTPSLGDAQRSGKTNPRWRRKMKIHVSDVAADLIALGAVSFAALLVATATVRAQTTDLVSRTALRVCADPANMPFSNEAGEGFENKIAE